MRAIDGYSGQPTTEGALKLAPLLFVRPGELRKAYWDEFDLDSEEPLGTPRGHWPRIPAETPAEATKNHKNPCKSH